MASPLSSACKGNPFLRPVHNTKKDFKLYVCRMPGRRCQVSGSDRGQEGMKVKEKRRDFPGGPPVKNPPSNAGDVGSIPGRGTKIPHATGQLGPRATTAEPARPKERSHVPQLRPDAAKDK